MFLISPNGATGRSQGRKPLESERTVPQVMEPYQGESGHMPQSFACLNYHLIFSTKNRELNEFAYRHTCPRAGALGYGLPPLRGFDADFTVI